MSLPAPPQPAPSYVVPPGWRTDDVWPEPRPQGRPRLVLAAALVGLAGALVLPSTAWGIGTFVVLAGIAAVVVAADARRASTRHLAGLLLSAALASTVLWRDAEWVVALCVLAAFAVGVTTLVEARTVAGLLAAGVAVPLAGLRGLPWLGRSLADATGGASRHGAAVARTVAVSALLATVFGLLLTSADAVLSTWVDVVVPDVSVDGVVERGVVAAFVAGLTLASAYVALNPLPVERLAPGTGGPVGRTFEWLVPVGLVTALLGAFVTAQATVLFGGHDYLRRTTGLTYAEYVHQGFAQLTVTTVLTLAVIGVAARKAPRRALRDRVLLRVVLGLLGALTLLVVASALHRMTLYTDAYGLTRLRLLVALFEGWLGLLLVLVLVAGVRLRGAWLPVAGLLSGAVALLALAVANPDARIAQVNLDRAERTGRLDEGYLAGLSADAALVLAERPDVAGRCRWTDDGEGHTGLSWNLSRWRAARVCPPSD